MTAQVPATLRNPAQEQLVAALRDALRKLPAAHSSDLDIHGARKDLKKARAALRLLRRGLGETHYQATNAALRDAGRLLAPMRNAKALVETFTSFRERFADELGECNLSAFHGVLRRDASGARRHFHGRAREITASRRIIRGVQSNRRASTQPIRLEVLGDGLQCIYRRGRKAARAADENPTAGNLHEWRKQVNYLRNAVNMLQDFLGRRARKVGSQAERLAEMLGDDHDLVVLSTTFAGMGATFVPLDTARHCQKLIERRRARVQRRARRLGAKLFADGATRFVRELLGDSRALI